MMALFKKELRTLFCSPLAYAVAAAFATMNGYVFWMLLNLLAQPMGQVQAELLNLYFGGTFFFWLSLTAMVPLITMRLISEEKHSGSIELLITVPITDTQIVMAKFWSVLIFYLFLWAPSFIYTLVTMSLGSFDWGIWLLCLVGVVLAGAMLLSLGLMCSAFFSHQLLAGVMAFGFLMVYFLFGFAEIFGAVTPLRTFMELTWLLSIFEQLGSGQLKSKHVIYLVSMTWLHLYVAVQALRNLPMEKLKIKRILLALVVIVLINYLGLFYNQSYDLTRDHLFSLSDKTHNVLESLDEDVDIVVFLQRTNVLYGKVKELLERYQDESSLIRVTYVDPVKDLAQTKILSSKYGVEFQEEMILVHHKYRTKLVPQRDVAIYDYSTVYSGMPPQLKSFAGEATITGAILNLQQTNKNRVYFLTGHGEKSLNDSGPEGLSELHTVLKKDNLEMAPLHLVGLKDLPEDLKCLVIAGPSHRLSDEELAFLKQFIEDGGRLLCMIDASIESNLVEFLKSYGIDVADNIILDPQRKQANTTIFNLFTWEYEPHLITEKMVNIYTDFLLARSVSVGNANHFQLQVLTRSSSESWGEVDYQVIPYAYEKGKDLAGPLSVGVVGEDPHTKAKLVVLGDSDFVCNQFIPVGGNKYFFMNTLHWLLDQDELISIPPKDIVSMSLPLTQRHLYWFFILFVVFMPLTWGVLGGIVYFVRRK